MAEIYRRVGGRKLEKVLAVNEGVQAELEVRTFEIAARAEALLAEHRLEGHAEITVEEGDVDKYVVLSDDRGDKGAMSIEYGRQARIDPETGEAHGEMQGLFILHRASNLPRRRKKKVRI
jgi:hypothetical protein